jgi:hypothetical protein
LFKLPEDRDEVGFARRHKKFLLRHCEHFVEMFSILRGKARGLDVIRQS